MVESRLREAVGPGSRLGGLRITPFLLRVEVRDLHVEGPGYALTVPQGRVVLSPRALRGAFALRSVEADGPILHLTAEGESDTPEEETDAGLPPLEIEAVVIRDATVRWSDPATGELVLEGLTVDGAIGSGALVIDVPRGMWRGEETLDVGPASVRLAVARDLDVALESLEARLGESRLIARGTLARRGAPALGIDLDAEVDLDDGGRALGLAELSGRLAVTGRLDGPLDGLRATLDGRGTAGWGVWAIEDLSLNLDARPGAQQAEAHLEGNFLGGRLEGEARLDGEMTSGRLGGRGLDLARLPAEMRLPLDVTGAEVELGWEGPFDGPLSVDLVTRGRGRVDEASGRLEARAGGTVDPRDGTADLEWSARVRGEASAPVALDLQLDTRGRLRGAWPPEVTGRLSGVMGPAGGAPETQTALAGSFRMQGDELSAQLESRGLVDLDAELEIRGDQIQDLSVVAERVDLARLNPEAAGRAHVQARASGPLGSPDLTVRVSVAGLEWGGAALGRLDVGAEGTLKRADVRAALPDLSIGAEGEFLGGEHSRLRGQVELRETPLARLAPLAGTAEPLSGQLTATLGFDLPLDRPAEAEATLDVHALEAVHRERSFRAEPFRAELRDGRLAAQGVRVEGEGVSLDLEASAGLGEDETVELRAWLDADLGALPLPEGWSVSGSLGGAVGLAGTRARPSLEGALHAANVAVSGPSAPEVEIDDVELYLGDEGLRLPLFTARVGTGRATLEGDVPYAAVWPALRGADPSLSERARLAAAWEDIPFGPLEGGSPAS